MWQEKRLCLRENDKRLRDSFSNGELRHNYKVLKSRPCVWQQYEITGSSRNLTKHYFCFGFFEKDKKNADMFEAKTLRRLQAKLDTRDIWISPLAIYIRYAVDVN